MALAIQTRFIDKVTVFLPWLPRRAVMPLSFALVLIPTLTALGFSYGPMVSVQPESALLSGGATAVADASASAGQSLKFSSNAANSCALPNYPTPDCTGIPTGTVLAADARCTLSTANEVITGKQFDCRLNVTADNVTIRNSFLAQGIDNWTGSGSFTIEDSTVGPATGCDSSIGFGIGARKFVARRVLVRGMPDGFRISNLASSETTTIEDSYYYSCSNTGDHSDGIQTDYSSGNATIRHNTLDLSNSSSATSPIFWGDGSGGSHGIIENNLLVGGGYNISLGTGNGHVISDNLFASWVYGPTYSDCDTVATWSGNRSATIDSNYNILTTGGLVPCS